MKISNHFINHEAKKLVFVCVTIEGKDNNKKLQEQESRSKSKMSKHCTAGNETLEFTFPKMSAFKTV